MALGYTLDANGNLVPTDPFGSFNAPVSTMDQVNSLGSSGNWLAPVSSPAGGGPPGFPSAGTGVGSLSALGKLGGWLGKNGQTIGTLGNLAVGGINAYLGLQQLGMAKDAFKFEKKAFKTNLANQVQSYNTQMKDRITGRWYATEEERQAAEKEAQLPQGMR